MTNTITYTLNIPLYVIIPHKRVEDERVYLNFNQYHNWYPFKRNMIKQLFTEQMGTLLSDVKPMNKITSIKYTVYKNNARKCDIRNITNLIDKFLCDSLVFYKLIPDDNYMYIAKTEDIWGGIDKDNPRVEVEINAICTTTERVETSN